MFNDHYLKLKDLKLLALINASELKSEWPTFFLTRILSPPDPHESSHTIADWMIPYIHWILFGCIHPFGRLPVSTPVPLNNQ